MNGIFFNSPTSLEEAIAPIATQCSLLDWSICLQSGPFRDLHFTDPDDERNALHLFYDFADPFPAWFRAGILPKYAPNLIHDEWSYYLGFDSTEISPEDLSKALCNDIGPCKRTLDLLAQYHFISLMFVDDGWWEAYTTDKEMLDTLTTAWDGRVVNSSRWDGPHEHYYPFPAEVT